MEILTAVLLYFAGVVTFYLFSTYQSGKDSHKLTEEFNQYKVSTTNAIIDLRNTLNSNIQTIGNANVAIEKLRKDLACYTEKVDKSDKEIENLQEHCIKLRESIIDVREVVAGKRPIHRHQPISVTISPQVLKPGDMINKVKKQLKDF
jgi:peptidoglycan hydrolase CwlO-like protein